MRQEIRAVTPNFALQIYRVVRNNNRYLFRAYKDKKCALKFRELILERFPELSVAKQNGVVLDLGANIGNFSHACVLLGYEVKSVEPHPIAFNYLRNRFKKSSEVQLHNVAVSDAYGMTKLYTHPQHKNDPVATSISASIIEDKFKTDSKSFDVEVVPLQTFFDTDLVYEMVKIDIEGAEMHLIDQLIENSHKIKRLLIETHERFMQDSESKTTYQIKMAKLELYISENGLNGIWLTDWI